MARQLVLDLPHRAARGVDDFLVAPCNETAVSWIDGWPDWPGNALILHGPAGCGKSHLAQIWRTRSGAAMLDASGLMTEHVPGLVRTPLVIDHTETLSDAEALFHLVNLMREEGQPMLFLSRLPPSQWHTGLPDLQSRIGAMQAVAVTGPDDEVLSAVLTKLLGDRQIRAGTDVIVYVAARIERSFAAAGAVVAALDAQALGEKRALTVPLARKVLASMAGLGESPADPADPANL